MNLTQRDHEILRTLVRVQFATTASLGRTFFPDLRAARRRLLTLRSVAGVITPHTKGLPGKLAPSGGQYWRLTETGLQTFAKKFPGERIPDNHIKRTRSASLLYFEHRNAMTDLYMRLISCKDRDIGELHARANHIDWRCEYEVVLPYKSLVGLTYIPKRIVPDATLTTGHARYFLEVDRSTETRKTCQRTLRNYGSAFEQVSYGSLFPDRLPSVVLYVTLGQGRADGLTKVIQAERQLAYKAAALPMQEAAEWLAKGLDAPPPSILPPKAVRRAVDYEELVQALSDIYSSYYDELMGQKERGERVVIAPSATKAYEVLCKIHDAA